MIQRACPTCECPAVSMWRLFSLGGLRRATCANCGARIGLSWLSSFILFALGTWIPVAGGIIGAIMVAGITENAWAIGGVAGMLFSGAIFGVLYFRGAKLVVT